MATFKSRAPFFTTRIGASVVTYDTQDPRAKRSPGQIRNDPRARFKDSYAQFAKHLSQWLGQFPDSGAGPELGADDVEDASHPARRELQRLLKRVSDRAGLSDKDADLVKVETVFVERLKERDLELQHLKYEHHDADVKNMQLRNALRASASALQHAATLMPPDIGIDVQEDDFLNQIQELQRQVVEKDNRIMELLKGTSTAQNLAARAEKTLQRALGQWAPSAMPLQLQREAYQAWSSYTRSGEVQHKKKEAEFQKRLGRSRAALQSKINGIVRDLAQASEASEARVVLEAWRHLTKEGRMEKEKKKMKEDQVRKTLMKWSSDFPMTALPAILFAWRRLLDLRQSEKKAEEVRREHMRLAKEEKKQRLAAVALALTADPKTMDPNAMRVLLRAWRQLMIETRRDEWVKKERQLVEERAQERLAEQKERAQRRFAMLIAEGNYPLLHGSFKAWHSKIAETKREEAEERFSYQQAVFRAWSAAFSAGRQQKELQQEKERLEKEQEELRKDLEEQRLRNSKIRVSLWGMTGDADGDLVLLRAVISSWKDFLSDQRQLHSRQDERRKVEQEFQERQEELRQSVRMRQSLIALSAVKQQLKGQKEVLLPILWSAWRELVDEKHRGENMDVTRRLYEEEARKSHQEAQHLQKEAVQMRERHLHAQQYRQAVFLMSLENRDRALLLKVALSAWRECVEDRRKHAVEDMRRKLAELNNEPVAIMKKGPASTTDPAYPGAKPRKGGVFGRCLPFCCGKKGTVSQAPSSPSSKAVRKLPETGPSPGGALQVQGGGDARGGESSRQVVEQPGVPQPPAESVGAGSSRQVVEQPGTAQPSLPAGSMEAPDSESNAPRGLRRFQDDDDDALLS